MAARPFDRVPGQHRLTRRWPGGLSAFAFSIGRVGLLAAACSARATLCFIHALRETTVADGFDGGRPLGLERRAGDAAGTGAGVAAFGEVPSPTTCLGGLMVLGAVVGDLLLAREGA